MGDTRCSARPAALVDYARRSDEVAWDLRRELHEFEHAIECFQVWLGPSVRVERRNRALWSLASALEDLATWVSNVGWAFAVAGAAGDASSRRTVVTSESALEAALQRTDWTPAGHLRRGKPGEWLRALDPRCRSFANAGYRGSGFLVGPDGRSYPVVAPFVMRDGVEYHADNGLAPGARSVLDLDGEDSGWTTLYEQTGVERWRNAPSGFERVMMGIGATVGGQPNGSSREDVEQLVIVPGAAPVFASALPTDRESSELPLATSDSKAPAYPSPRQPDTQYPGNNPRNGVANGAPIAIDFVSGAVMADQGSHAAYDVVFQQNEDGRVRALYKRVYVGFDENGQPFADSTWVYGPDSTEQVMINYVN